MDDTGRGERAFLVGQRVYLRPVEKEDALFILRWANDPQIRRLTAEVTPMTQAGFDEFLHKVQHDPDRVWFMVVLKGSNRVIGEAGLLRMFPPWRATDLTIILGEPEAWRQGYGTEAILLLLDYAFGALNFHRVAVGVVGFNERAIHFYEKIGFKTEGIQRDGYFCDHVYHDFIMMSILEAEYRQRYDKNKV
jgi:RimJ/RimL family protein N-acetyltransferase